MDRSTKTQIVLDGLSGKRGISNIYTHYEISQEQYYKWRDKLLSQGATIFDSAPDQKVERLEAKVKGLTWPATHSGTKKTEKNWSGSNFPYNEGISCLAQ